MPGDSKNAQTTFWSTLLTTDFCPGVNRYVYLLKRPLTIMSLTGLAALVCGMSVSPQGYVVAGILASVIAVGMVWPWLGLRGMSATANFEQSRITEGEAVTLTLEITNRWPWPVWGLVLQGFLPREYELEDDSTANVDSARASGVLTGVEGWATARFEFVLVPPVRGVYPVEAPRLATAFPFGVWTSSRSIAIRKKLFVWPKRFPLNSRPLPSGRQTAALSASDHRQGDIGEVTNVRPYRQGDSLRNIHWSHTARLDRFVVKERQDCACGHSCVQICVDALLLADRSSQGAWEWSLRTAASVTDRLTVDHSQVQLWIGQRLLAVPSSRTLRQSFFDALSATLPQVDRAVTIPSQRREVLWVCIGSREMAANFPEVEQADVRLIVDPAEWPEAWRQQIGMLHRLPPSLEQQWHLAAGNAWRGSERVA